MLSWSILLPTSALMVSLGSAFYSYRLSRRAHHVNTYYGAISLFRDLDNVFISYPELRAYFYGGKQATGDDSNAMRVQAVAELVCDVFEWIWHRQEKLTGSDKGGWQAYILDTFAQSPALRHHFVQHTSWYPGVARLLRENLHVDLPTKFPLKSRMTT
jgi:hypothetical protein